MNLRRAAAIGLLLGASVAFAETEVVLAVGEQRTREVPGLARLSVTNPHLLEVQTAASDAVRLIGHAPGRTTLVVWKQGGERVSYEIVVRPKKP